MIFYWVKIKKQFFILLIYLAFKNNKNIKDLDMGIALFDPYSPSHAFGGVTFYLLGFDFLTSILLHTAFEIFENYIWIDRATERGGYCLKLPFFPVEDCKTKPDSVMNIIGDTISFAFGFLVLAWLKPGWTPLAKWHWLAKAVMILFVIPLGYSLITTNILGYLPAYEHS